MSTVDVSPGGVQYLDVIDLKFAEGVSKALANASGTCAPAVSAADPCLAILKGRKPLPPGRGTALGKLIIEELNTASSDIYLHRAVLRLMHRPLSVFHNNLSSMLLRILPFVETSPLAQTHAIAFATVAAELIECMDSIGLGASGDNSVRNDALRGIRDGLESLVKRVVTPLITMIKLELNAIIDTLALPVSASGDTQRLVALSSAMPSASQRLAAFTSLPGNISQSAMASLLIGLVWRSLVALSSRPLPQATLSPSTVGKVALAGAKVKKDGSFTFSRPPSSAGLHAATTAASVVPSMTTPPTTPRFKGLPIPSLSRPPSPASGAANVNKNKQSAPSHPLQQLLLDAQGTCMLVATLPSPAVGSFAREAVDEAFEAFDSFVGFLKWAASLASATDPIGRNEMGKVLAEKTEGVSALIALPILLQLLPHAQFMSLATSPSVEHADESKKPVTPTLTVPSLIGISGDEYRSSCLAGFGRAEVCAEAIGRGVLNRLQLDEAGYGVRPSSPKEGLGPGKEAVASERGAIDVHVIRAWLVEKISVGDGEDHRYTGA